MEEVEEGKIPSVSEEGGGKKKHNFFVGVLLLISAGAAILVGIGSEEVGDEQDSLEARVEKEYETGSRNLIVPELTEAEKKERAERKRAEVDKRRPFTLAEKEPEKVKVLKRPRKEVEDELPLPVQVSVESKEELRKRRKQEQLMEQRRRANPVVFDENSAQGEIGNNGDTYVSQISNNRKPLDVEAVTKTVTDKLQGLGKGSVGGFGGGNKKDLGTKLSGASIPGVTAKVLDNQQFIIAEGKVLGCLLETAIHSSLPGMTRCILAEDIYSFDGTSLLLRKGSRLIGQYEGGVQQGESRIFVVWKRVLTPEGIDVTLSSPGTDELGRAGHDMSVDSRFFQRFGASALLSIVGGLTAPVDGSDVRLQEVGKSFNKSSEIALKDSIDIAPVGIKNQGERIKVFVARDLDFTPVAKLLYKAN